MLIDNTPPVVTLSAPRAPTTIWKWMPMSGQDFAAAPLRVFAGCGSRGFRWKRPMASPIRRASSFTSRSRSFAPGEHLLVVRAYDTANNAGLAKVVVQ